MYTSCIRKCVLLFGILICLQLKQANAQQGTYYTLLQLIDTAQNHLPVLFQKQALISSAKANVVDVRHSFLPQLKVNDQLNLGTDNSIAGSYLPVGVTPSSSAGVRGSNDNQAASGNIAVLYSEYELMNFGLRDARIKNAEAYVSLQQADYQKELYYLKTEISRLYFTLLKNQFRLSADKENVTRYENIFTIIHALTGSGITAGVDSSLAKAELAKTRISYNQSLGNINQVKQQLSYLTGIDASRINVDTTRGNYLFNNSLLNNMVNDTVNNPLIDYYSKTKNVYLSNEKLVAKSYLPKILLAGSTWARGSSIQYNDDYKALTEGIGYQRFNYMAGIAVTYDLFNGIHRRDKLATSRLQTQASDYLLQQQKLALASANLQADNTIQVTEANLQQIPIQLTAATDAFEQKVAQYKAGIISLIDLTNASFVLYRSQTDYIETLSDWYLAKLDKAAATNNLDLFIQTIK